MIGTFVMKGNTKLTMWTSPAQSIIFKNIFRDCDTFAMIPLVAFAAISHENFGIFLYLIFEKRSTTNAVDINKQ